MPQPYNYNVAQIDPFGSALKGMQTGMAFNQATEQQAQQKQLFEQGQAKLAQQEQLQAQQVQAKAQMDLKLANLSENYSMDNLNKFVIENPSYMKQFEPLMERISGKEKESTIRDGLQLYAMSISNPKRAVEEAKKRADALRESGDEKQASFFDAMAETAELDPKAFTTALGIGLSSAMGFDKFAESTKNLATANKTELENKGAKEQYSINLDNKKTLLAKSKQELIRFIQQNKDASDLNKGITPKKDALKELDTFRNKYKSDAKGFLEMQKAYQTLSNTTETGPGDLAMVFSFMNVLDPGVAVMEGDVINAQNAAGKLARMSNLWNEYSDGRRFKDKASKQKFIDQAKKVMDTATEVNDFTKNGMTKILKRRGHSDEQIESVFSTVKEFVEDADQIGSDDKIPRNIMFTAPDGQEITFSSQAALDIFKQKTGLK